ncbi:uncharacterized protein SPSK_08159 [Sporothrix schenckii 1099-18]|uniref:Uncharacterized protein n=1 Tax=Sporothrix schenckii 1099-18 TaxID=1397361 RepID=A0A0F2MJ00_SPOSC|nr:uncharacterized protein SPSK_08159 [Sporothrix schenckii 1099-18]KJR88835.1 hypothetical protein SPSK_08159 [Sporothrix schenckii 1099-18]
MLRTQFPLSEYSKQRDTLSFPSHAPAGAYLTPENRRDRDILVWEIAHPPSEKCTPPTSTPTRTGQPSPAQHARKVFYLDPCLTQQRLLLLGAVESVPNIVFYTAIRD